MSSQSNNMRTPYRPPANLDRSEVENLMPEHAMGAVLLPTTPVVIINRGNKRLEDKYDGHDYVLQPGRKYEVSYAAALHLQKRLIVPGTKTMDASLPSYVSYLGIFGIDNEEACQLFTAEQLAALGEPTEAFYRDQNDPLQRGFTTINVRAEAAKIPGHGLVPPQQALDAQASGGGIGLRQEIVGGSEENRAAVTEPVASDAVHEEAAARNAGYENPDENQLRVRSAEPHTFKSSEPPAEALIGVGQADPSGAPSAPPIGKNRGGGRKK